MPVGLLLHKPRFTWGTCLCVRMQDVRGAMAAAGVPLAPFKGGVGAAAGATSGLHVI